jgi:hypothetical protein
MTSLKSTVIIPELLLWSFDTVLARGHYNQNARLYERKTLQSQRKFHLEKKKSYTCLNAEAIYILLSLPIIQSSLIRCFQCKSLHSIYICHKPIYPKEWILINVWEFHIGMCWICTYRLLRDLSARLFPTPHLVMTLGSLIAPQKLTNITNQDFFLPWTHTHLHTLLISVSLPLPLF